MIINSAAKSCDNSAVFIVPFLLLYSERFCRKWTFGKKKREAERGSWNILAMLEWCWECAENG